MTNDDLARYRNTLISDPEKGFIAVANEISQSTKLNLEYKTKEQAIQFLRGFVRILLESGKYIAAAKLLWPPQTFNPDPCFCSTFFSEIKENEAIMILGAAGTGKSFSASVWSYLDWIRDPEDTTVFLISASAEHAESNIFAHTVDLHKSASIPMEGVIQTNMIVPYEQDKRAGIRLMTIPDRNEGKGKLRGNAPRPRRNAHPVFVKSRVRIILDEAELIPRGVWEDIENILSKKFDLEHIKVIAATNPSDRSSEMLLRCEPPGGWGECGIVDRWTSNRGYRVLHFDAEMSENVQQKKVVYPGMQTYEGYLSLIQSTGGIGSPSYWSMCRGWPAQGGSKSQAIPIDYLNKNKGEIVFESYTQGMSFDLAFEGDNTVCCMGRWGIASGFMKEDGAFMRYEKPTFAVQLDQLIKMSKGDTLEIAEIVMTQVKSAQVKPENVIIDRSGNATGVYHLLRKPNYLGDKILAVEYVQNATNTKIMADDELTALFMYDRVDTELFMAMRRYLEFGYIKLGPQLYNHSQLFKELSNRSFHHNPQTGKIKIEPKAIYRKTFKHSPDHADAACLFLHMARIRNPTTPPKMSQSSPDSVSVKKRGLVPSVGYVDQVDYMYD